MYPRNNFIILTVLEEPPICRDYNECQDSPCHPTAICGNRPGTFECYCDERDSLQAKDGSCEPMLEFYKSYSTLNEVDPVQNSASCNVTSDSIFVSWKITPRWEFDSNVIDKFVVSWFPYENEKDRFGKPSP